jgi:uncharacterized protein involved in outer membrane biogenesis
MKKLLKILAGILIVIVILFVALLVWLDTAIVNGFNSAAPTALGVPASLGDARILPVRGKLTLNDLHIGNPEGYKTSGLLDMGTLFIRFDTASVMTDTILINEITIDGLVITYEKGLRDSNLGALIDLLSSEEKSEEKEEKAEEAEGEKKAKKKVIIEKLMITNSKMNFSATGMMGAAIPIPLPAITLTDLGKESEGITAVQAIQKVLTAIAGATGTAIAGSGKLIGQGVQAVGEGIGQAGEAIGQAANEAGKAVGDTLKNINPFGK